MEIKMMILMMVMMMMMIMTIVSVHQQQVTCKSLGVLDNESQPLSILVFITICQKW